MPCPCDTQIVPFKRQLFFEQDRFHLNRTCSVNRGLRTSSNSSPSAVLNRSYIATALGVALTTYPKQYRDNNRPHSTTAEPVPESAKAGAQEVKVGRRGEAGTTATSLTGTTRLRKFIFVKETKQLLL